MIYLIRHGQTTWNNERRFQGIMDVPLDDVGKHQAHLLSLYFKHHPLTCIYTSDLSRALDTAEAIHKYNPVPVLIDQRIRELNVGIWEGMRWDVIKDEFSGFLKKAHASGYVMPIPEGESLIELKARASAFFKDITAKHKDESVAIVTHGGVIRMFMLEVYRQDLSFYNQVVLENGSITTLVWHQENQAWKAISVNNLNHLNADFMDKD